MPDLRLAGQGCPAAHDDAEVRGPSGLGSVVLRSKRATAGAIALASERSPRSVQLVVASAVAVVRPRRADRGVVADRVTCTVGCGHCRGRGQVDKLPNGREPHAARCSSCPLAPSHLESRFAAPHSVHSRHDDELIRRIGREGPVAGSADHAGSGWSCSIPETRLPVSSSCWKGRSGPARGSTAKCWSRGTIEDGSLPPTRSEALAFETYASDSRGDVLWRTATLGSRKAL